MFNLLMFNVDWTQERVPLKKVRENVRGRIFEYTDDHIAEQFREGDNLLFDRLTSLPCLFCQEGRTDETAYVGKINKARIVGIDILLEISLDEEVPQLQNSTIYANRAKLHMLDDFEFSRSHWAVKDVDLYRFLLRNVRPRRQHPTAFKIPEHETIEPTLASAMMPFNAEFDAVYDTIQKAADTVGLQCRRADNFWENAKIMDDVIALIDRSRIVVCDCSGKNPNVFYETGIAHTLGREVILIAQSEHDIPFDLRQYRYILYLNNAEGLTKLIYELKQRMKTLIGR